MSRHFSGVSFPSDKGVSVTRGIKSITIPDGVNIAPVIGTVTIPGGISPSHGKGIRVQPKNHMLQKIPEAAQWWS